MNYLNRSYHITAHCRIAQQAVEKNGQLLFETDASVPVSDFLVAAYRHFSLDHAKFYKMDQLSKLGWLCAEILLKDDYDPSAYAPEETGMVLSNANASLDTDLRFVDTWRSVPSPAVFVYTLPSIVLGEISIRHRLKGESVFFISEKFDPVFMQAYVGMLLDEDVIKACIMGWVDVLDGVYHAHFFLVEQKEQGSLFSAANCDILFHQKKREI